MGGISIWQLLIIVAIIVLLFGTKKLKSLGSDLGASIKGFKKALDDDDRDTKKQQQQQQQKNTKVDMLSLEEKWPVSTDKEESTKN